MKIVHLLPICTVLLLFSGCNAGLQTVQDRTLQWTEVFRDDFDGSTLDMTKWKYPQWQFGNSKMMIADNGNTSPVLSSGVASFKLETYNSEAVGYLRGSFIHTVPEWTVGDGVEFECVCRNRTGTVKGVVNAFWLDNWSRQNDPAINEPNHEIDVEMLMNFVLNSASPDYGKITVATHHATATSNVSHGKYVLVPALDQLAYNKYVIRWYPDHVEWYANDVKFYDTRDDGIPAADIPDSPLQAVLESWAAAPEDWAEAADAGLQPTTIPASNQAYYFDVDSVVVRKLQ